MNFQRHQATTLELEQPVIISAQPALAGVTIFLEMKGRATQYGVGAIPLFGRVQFGGPGSGMLWPALDLTSGSSHTPKFNSDHSEHLYYEGYLSHSQLEAFENARNGKDFTVAVKASLSVLNNDGQVEKWVIQNTQIHKTAQEWLTVLANAGYKKYLFQTMAFPADASAKPNSVYHHLFRARELFDKALYRECVGSLRLAQDLLRERREDKECIDGATKKYRDTREAMTLAERMLFLRNSVQNALHAGPHHDAPHEAFDREIVKALLTMVSALVELYPEPS